MITILLGTPGLPIIQRAAAGCDFYDVPCKTKEALNSWFLSMSRSALQWTFKNLAQGMLTTPQVDATPRVQALTSNSVVIANTCFVLLVTIGGYIILSYQTLQTSYTTKEIAPRLITGFILANVTPEILNRGIFFTNALSDAVLGPEANGKQADAFMVERILATFGTGSTGFVILVAFVAAVLAVLLAIVVTLRVFTLLLLAVLAPLALACHALPQTEGIAKTWWRMTGAVFAIQFIHAILFSIMRSVLFTGDKSMAGWSGQGWDMLLVIAVLYVMIRVPSWITRSALGGAGGGRKGVVSRIAQVVIYRQIFAAVRRGR